MDADPDADAWEHCQSPNHRNNSPQLQPMAAAMGSQAEITNTRYLIFPKGEPIIRLHAAAATAFAAAAVAVAGAIFFVFGLTDASENAFRRKRNLLTHRPDARTRSQTADLHPGRWYQWSWSSLHMPIQVLPTQSLATLSILLKCCVHNYEILNIFRLI